MCGQLLTFYGNLTLSEPWFLLTTKLISIEAISKEIIHCSLNVLLLKHTHKKKIWRKGGNPILNLSHLEFLRVTFLSWCADEQAKAAEVMVASYFWRGYQQPCDIGLSDRTSVASNTPLTLLGQAFLSVSRHTQPPVLLPLLPLSELPCDGG